MKVIDLLNKIANGEGVPTKIVFDDTIYKVKHNNIIDRDYYIDNEDNLLLKQINNVWELNEKVGISEDKKIETIDPIDYCHSTDTSKDMVLVEKINEIIKVINEMREDK